MRWAVWTTALAVVDDDDGGDVMHACLSDWETCRLNQVVVVVGHVMEVIVRGRVLDYF